MLDRQGQVADRCLDKGVAAVAPVLFWLDRADVFIALAQDIIDVAQFLE